MTTYRCILMDPNWNERGGGKSKRGADAHYDVMAVHKILDLIRLSPAWRPNLIFGCHLWMWATSNYRPDAQWLMSRLGFRYVTDWVWVKPGNKVGLGQYRRSKHEHLLLGRAGPIRRIGQWPTSVLTEPRRRHSQKPDVQYKLCEKVSPGPRLEMFARNKQPGWHWWGNEVGYGHDDDERRADQAEQGMEPVHGTRAADGH